MEKYQRIGKAWHLKIFRNNNWRPIGGCQVGGNFSSGNYGIAKFHFV